MVGRRRGLRDVGDGGLERLRRRRIAPCAPGRRGRRLHLLRHGVRLWGRPERATPRPDSPGEPRARPDRGHEGAAEGWPVAGPAGCPAQGGLPHRPRPRVRGEEPGQPGHRCDRPPPAPRLERRVGRGRALAARRRRPAAREADPGVRDQRQPLGAGERHPGPPDRPGGRRPGHLQHLRPGAGGRALPGLPRARRGRHRAGPLRRRLAHRDADRRLALAGGRLAEQLLRAGEPAGHGPARGGNSSARAGGHDDGRDGAPVHPLQPGRRDRHPRHAERGARRGRTSARAIAGRSRPGSWRHSARTAGIAGRPAGPSSGRWSGQRGRAGCDAPAGTATARPVAPTSPRGRPGATRSVRSTA